MIPQIEESWKKVLKDEFEKDYMKELSSKLKQEKEMGNTFYPPPQLIFNAFNHTPYTKVRAVILGQDPYHGKGQAMGLSFSVRQGVTPPPSLKNIYKELESDLGIKPENTNSGDLTPWADNGVLLLNTTLTVAEGQPASHSTWGWQRFTRRVIEELNKKEERIVFILWGKHAQEKEALIKEPHRVIKSPHPSPFSAHNGFFGSKPFSKTNELFREEGLREIDWKL